MTAKPVRHASQSTLFLLELIIATAFLALSSVVCIRLYLYAHVLSTSSALKTQATLQLQNLASSWLSSDGTLSSALSLYEESAEEAAGAKGSLSSASSLSSSEDPRGENPEASTSNSAPSSSEDTAGLYYNENGELLSSPEDAAFCILLSMQKADSDGILRLSLLALPVKDGQVSSDSSASYGDLTVERYDAASAARYDTATAASPHAVTAVHPGAAATAHSGAAVAAHLGAAATAHSGAARSHAQKEARL